MVAVAGCIDFLKRDQVLNGLRFLLNVESCAGQHGGKDTLDENDVMQRADEFLIRENTCVGGNSPKEFVVGPGLVLEKLMHQDE